MSRQQAKTPEPTRMNTELFTLTYGSLVAQIVKDFESDDAINEQLDTIGFNIGEKLAEDFVAKGNSGRCADFKETATQLVNGFKLFLGFSPTVTKLSPSGDEFSLILDSNPLTEFVDLPADHPKLLYSNVIAGAIRGALHNMQMEVDARFVQDQLLGDKVNEIRVKFIRRIKEMVSSSQSSSSSGNTLEPWLLKALRLLNSSNQHDTARLRRMYKDACENEMSITRITLADALRSEVSEETANLERGSSRSRIAAPAPVDVVVQNEPSSSKLAPKLINLFDVPSTKARGPNPPANIIPVVVTQGKTIIPDQPASVVMTTPGIVGNESNVNLGSVEDLVAECLCYVCGRMIPASDSSNGENVTKNNGMVECSKCLALYHQLCHDPPLPTSRVPSEWICSKCSEGVSASSSSSSVHIKRPEPPKKS
nr:Trafficking protein particle complex subunit 3 [Hymenolepis microstoma]